MSDTGEVKLRRPRDQDFFSFGMGHHRCYRNKATDNYLLLPKRATEFIDIGFQDIRMLVRSDEDPRYSNWRVVPPRGTTNGVLIFALSMLNLAVLFPDFVEEKGRAELEFLKSRDMPEKVIEAQVEKLDSNSAASESAGGLFGTFFTSLIGGAIIAISQRKK